MKTRSRRLGCGFFGLTWAIVFVLTNVGLALGDFADGPDPEVRRLNPASVAFWIEIAVLVVGGWLFYRAEMKDGEV